MGCLYIANAWCGTPKKAKPKEKPKGSESEAKPKSTAESVADSNDQLLLPGAGCLLRL
jgi:hypothetical protein